VQRSLTLIAKVIQSLANLNAVGFFHSVHHLFVHHPLQTVQKETFMRGVQDFLKDSLPAMVDYLVVVSTPLDETHFTYSDESNRHDRLNVVNGLRQRTKNMTVLDRESVPILPHLLDIPKHLAIITSAVIRSSRDLNARPRTGDSADLAVDDFCTKCFEVEEEALLRVSQLATKLATEHRRPSVQDVASNGLVSEALNDLPRSPMTEITSTVVSTTARPPRRRRLSRPSTAPSPTGSNSPNRHQLFFGDAAITRTFTRTVPDTQTWSVQNNRSLHLKAPSTDSFPSPGLPVSIHLPPPPIDPPEDPGKRKKGLLRGILRR